MIRVPICRNLRHLQRYRLIGALLFALVVAPVSGSTRLNLRVDEGPDSARIVITFPVPIDFTAQTENGEVLIRFAGPVEIANLDRIDPASSKWISTFRTGYDTLLIRSSRKVHFRVSRQEDRLVIEMTARKQISPKEQQSAAVIQLSLLKARLYIETGRFGKASQLLEGLYREYPRNADVAAALASLRQAVEKRRPALELYEEALGLEPENEDYRKAEAELRTPYRPKVEFGLEYKTVSHAQTEWIQQLRGQVNLGRHWVAGLAYDLNLVDSGPMRLADGTAGTFSELRQRVEMLFSYDFNRGDTIQASILVGRSGAGAGFQYRRPDDHGATDLLIDIRRPNWDFIEGVVNGISRNRIQLRRTHRFGWDLLASVSVADNRYRTIDLGTGATSLGFEAGLTYRLADRPIFIQYGVEAEYRQSILILAAPDGTDYFPVPLLSREIHFFDASFSRQWTETCRMEAFAGYGLDRLGGDGPFAGAQLRCEPRSGLGGQLWVDNRLNSANTNQAVLRLGGTLFWRF